MDDRSSPFRCSRAQLYPSQTRSCSFVDRSVASGERLNSARNTHSDVHEILDGGATSCFDVASPRCAGSISPWGKVCFATSR